MSKVTYEHEVMQAFLGAASAARATGMTWVQTLAVAQQAGFKGGRSTLQKLVDSMPIGGKPNHRLLRPIFEKNTVKTAEVSAEPSNEFTFTTAPATRETETLASIQNRLLVLREGAEYARPISLFDGSFQLPGAGEINAWSRILEKVEAVTIVNSNETFARGGDVLVDSELNPPGSALTIIHATTPDFAVGATLPVQRRDDGTAFVAIRELGPMAMLVLSNAAQMVLA